jgi:hypothetical protein
MLSKMQIENTKRGYHVFCFESCFVLVMSDKNDVVRVIASVAEEVVSWPLQ